MKVRENKNKMFAYPLPLKTAICLDCQKGLREDIFF
jgi:hypothetical protein